MPSIHFARALSDDEQAAVQERSMAHEEELRQFDKFMHKLDKVPLADLMSVFNKKWNEDTPLGDVHWKDFRGAFGDSVLHMICIRRTATKGHHRELLDEILGQLMKQESSLIGLGYALEPYTGESLLHMAVANSDVEMVAEIIQQLVKLPDYTKYLDARASGVFFKHLVSSPMEPKRLSDQFVTPLTVALIAPQEDAIALKLVEMLIKAGASTEFRDEHNEIHSTVMHHLAKCRWNHGVDYQGRKGKGGFISVERLQQLFELLTSGAEIPRVRVNTKDRHGNTALQLAAIIGNGEFLRCNIQEKAVSMWQWGQNADIRFPLDEIDSGGPGNEEASVIELLAVHRHKTTLSMGLFVHILEDKWRAYGRKILVLRVSVLIALVVATTIATAFTNSIPAPIRRIFCLAALCIAIVLGLYIAVMFAMRSRSEWFWRLHWVPLSGSRFHGSIWGLGVMNDFILVLLSAVVCALHLWEEHLKANQQTTILEWIDEISSVLVFLGWFQLLRYLPLFQTTTGMVGTLPQIFKNDVLPFALVLLIFMIASAGAIKVATAHSVSRSDEILGTFASTFASLEESMHGPDVNWRSTIEGRPLMAAVIFLVFLWMATVVLFNILIALFTSRFQLVRREHHQEFLLRWCGEMITQEKFIPVWLWDSLNLQIGMPMDQGRYGTNLSSGSDVERGHGQIPDERSALLAKERLWLPMEQNRSDETWGRPVDHWKIWK